MFCLCNIFYSIRGGFRIACITLPALKREELIQSKVNVQVVYNSHTLLIPPYDGYACGNGALMHTIDIIDTYHNKVFIGIRWNQLLFVMY